MFLECGTKLEQPQRPSRRGVFLSWTPSCYFKYFNQILDLLLLGLDDGMVSITQLIPTISHLLYTAGEPQWSRSNTKAIKSEKSSSIHSFNFKNRSLLSSGSKGQLKSLPAFIRPRQSVFVGPHRDKQPLAHYGQFKVSNWPHMNFFELWEEPGKPGENPLRRIILTILKADTFSCCSTYSKLSTKRWQSLCLLIECRATVIVHPRLCTLQDKSARLKFSIWLRLKKCKKKKIVPPVNIFTWTWTRFTSA